jgi:hypothetical protein
VELDKGGIYEAWGNGELAHLARAAVPLLKAKLARNPVARTPNILLYGAPDSHDGMLASLARQGE